MMEQEVAMVGEMIVHIVDQLVQCTGHAQVLTTVVKGVLCTVRMTGVLLMIAIEADLLSGDQDPHLPTEELMIDRVFSRVVGWLLKGLHLPL